MCCRAAIPAELCRDQTGLGNVFSASSSEPVDSAQLLFCDRAIVERDAPLRWAASLRCAACPAVGKCEERLLFDSCDGRETMKFEYPSGNRRSRRKSPRVDAPGMIESLENRSLLSATPSIVSPGVPGAGPVSITDQFQKIGWTEVEDAIDYDVWISDVEAREATKIVRGLPPDILEYTPDVSYNLGVSRVWVRAGFADGSHSAWSTPLDLRLQTAPVITGPVGVFSPIQISEDDFAISWDSAPGAKKFEVFLSNQTEGTSRIYRVDNLTAALDAAGQPIPGGDGDVLRSEVRSLYLDGAVAVLPVAPISVTEITDVNGGADLDLTIPAHGLKSGETVRITGVEGTTAANGTWLVRVLDSDTIRLRGVASNGAYTGGGAMVPATRLQSNIGLGDYRVFIRSMDDATPGVWSAWSDAFDFSVGTKPDILRPSGPTFDSPILLEWSAVDDATHYELEVRDAGDGSEIVSIPYLQGTDYRLPGSQQVRLNMHLLNTNTLRFTSNPTAGTFRLQLTVDGSTTAPLTTPYLPWNANAATIQSAVAGLGYTNATCRAVSGGFELTLPSGVSVSGLSNLDRGGISSTAAPATSGSYRLKITESGDEPRIQSTRELPWNATAAQIRDALQTLGYSDVSVRTLAGESPVHEITLNRLKDAVSVAPVASLKSGSITSSNRSIRTDWGDVDFRVRARRVGATTELAVNGNPTAGQFTLKLTTLEDDPVVLQTDALAHNATAAQVESALQRLEGFAGAKVRSRGPEGNVIYTIYLPQYGAPVVITAEDTLNAGQVTILSRRQSEEVVGLWSDLTTFSTEVVPVIPVANGTQFTSARPEIEFSAVDRAARYDIWVERSTDSEVFLQTTTSKSIFRFSEDIPAGNYSFWVRAVSQSGELSAWSRELKFSTTAGAPVILSPQEGLNTPNPLPRITWGAVDGAVEYEVFVAWLGVEFEFINETGRLSTSFTPNNPLNPGTYRAWVRGVTADGTSLPWSAARTFTVT